VKTPFSATLYTCSDTGSGCAARGRLLHRELRSIGIKLCVEPFPRDIELNRDTAPKPRFDLADEGFVYRVLDPKLIIVPVISEARLHMTHNDSRLH
jgi:hypothetical protein